MSIEVGKTYYFIVHAYHHVVGTVEAITGRRECVLTGVRKIHSCGRGWTEFFRDGFGTDTRMDALPDGVEISNWMMSIPWNHPIEDQVNAPRHRR